MLPTVSAKDIGHPTEPGEYCVADLFYQVDRQHLAVWREKPDTVFRTILCNKVNDDRTRLTLGAPLEA